MKSLITMIALLLAPLAACGPADEVVVIAPPPPKVKPPTMPSPGVAEGPKNDRPAP